MEKNIDREISHAEVQHIRQVNDHLNRQNDLLKKEVEQLKDRQTKTAKELAGYKRIVFESSTGNEVL
jgi:hypothetical protein